MLEDRIKARVRDVQDFPKKGIVFKDLTPLLKDHVLYRDILNELTKQAAICRPDVIIGIESRGFWFGPPMAMELKIPFIPLRKKGKLPYETISLEYELEYGSAEIEIHTDAINPGQRVLIHDDLLATGGTARAAAELSEKAGGVVVGFSFLVELSFLNGRSLLRDSSDNIANLARW